MAHVEEIADLCGRFLAGAMTASAFVNEFMPLWRTYCDTPAATDVGNYWTDRVMTVADCYDHPAPGLCLSEDELRSEIAEHLQEAQ
jgi:hypothetical protein